MAVLCAGVGELLKLLEIQGERGGRGEIVEDWEVRVLLWF